MIIRNVSDEEYRKLGQTIRYRGVELQETRPLLYDENQTPFQKKIEMMVTNGRGYLSIQNALDVVNKGAPKLTLYDTLDIGLAPLYFKEPLISDIDSINPCGEIPLINPSRVPMLFAFRQKTLLERLRTQQKVFWMEDNRKKSPKVLFNACLITPQPRFP